MQIRARNVPRVEFVGLNIEITSSKNPSIKGMKGKIINETKNMFEIETEEGETKKLIKEQITFKTKIKNKNFIIEGKVLKGKPEDRTKKIQKI
tara:strand:- start:328 stop:606 length:279 start_codon:yes stop_codon:yes gene_type:complete